jgi:hypothetical protein
MCWVFPELQNKIDDFFSDVIIKNLSSTKKRVLFNRIEDTNVYYTRLETKCFRTSKCR